jgi:hypothetical protein
MATKTIADLTKFRAELVDRRRREAYAIDNANDQERVEKLAYVHLAIQAFDAVIEEGWSDEPSA